MVSLSHQGFNNFEFWIFAFYYWTATFLIIFFFFFENLYIIVYLQNTIFNFRKFSNIKFVFFSGQKNAFAHKVTHFMQKKKHNTNAQIPNVISKKYKKVKIYGTGTNTHRKCFAFQYWFFCSVYSKWLDIHCYNIFISNLVNFY